MGTETLMLLAALSCSGLCCLGVAVVLLGGVLYAMNSARNEGGGGALPWPFGGSDEGAAQPPVGDVVASGHGAPAPSAPDIAMPAEPSGSGDDPLGAPIDPHAPSRSSGQTIIAFDDEEDDW